MSNVSKIPNSTELDAAQREKLFKLAKEIFLLWEPGLRSLLKRFSSPADDSTYAAITSFLGLHCALRLEWYPACNGVPSEGNSHNPTFPLDEWTCLFRPLTGSTAWGLVHGTGLPPAGATFADMEKSAVRQSVLDLYDSETQKATAGTDFSVSRSGMRTYATMHLQEAQDIFHQWGIYQGADALLRIPVLSCKVLAQQWPYWQESVRPLRSILQQHGAEEESLCTEVKLSSTYGYFANCMWLLLQEHGLLNIALWQKPTLGNLFGLSKPSQSFNGIFVVVGDHTRLWQGIGSANVL